MTASNEAAIQDQTKFLHCNFQGVGELPSEGFIPIGEEDSIVCDA